jgi:hypothetical protein
MMPPPLSRKAEKAPLPLERGERLGEGGKSSRYSTAGVSPLTPACSPASGGAGESGS